MGQTTAAAFTIGSAVVQMKQQKALGKYNQQVSERNAQIAEQEANQIGQQAEFDIARFDQKFRQAEGTVEVQLAKSGVVIDSGSGARVTEANALEAEMERKITRYNADMGAAKKLEEANFSRIQGQMARREARIANIQTAAKAGSSLLQIYAPNSIYSTPTTTGTKTS